MLFYFVSNIACENVTNTLNSNPKDSMVKGFDTRIFSNVRQSPDCHGPSRKLTDDGKCICNDGYFHDDPISERGCWICMPSCGEGMKCEYPGVCRCLPGYYHIGFRGCRRAIPFAESYFPTSGKQLTTINISLKSLSNFTADAIYCKFNNTVTTGKIITQNLAQCTVPEVKSTKITDIFQIYLSYDNGSWSTQDIQFKIYNFRKTVNYFQVMMVVCAVVVIIGIIIWQVYVFKTKGFVPNEQDGQPLLRSA